MGMQKHHKTLLWLSIFLILFAVISIPVMKALTNQILDVTLKNKGTYYLLLSFVSQPWKNAFGLSASRYLFQLEVKI